MKPYLLLFLTALLNLNAYSQIKFEKGYFIDNSDQKVDILIRNVDWRSNPSQFEYKLSADGASKNALIKSVKEFGIADGARFVRHTVNVDRSSGNIKNLSEDRNPEYKEEELFLKLLVEGKANLYSLEDGNITRYFYSKDDSEIIQLIYKKYMTPEKSIATNDGFRQQIWNSLKCSDLTIRKVENLDYKKKDLTSFFVDYNECHDQPYTIYEQKQQKDLFNLSVRPGLNFSSLSITNANSGSKNTDFDDEIRLRLGVEAEFILPFNKNKWAIIFEPTYQHFKSEQTQEKDNVSGGALISKIDYPSIELPVGIRHYLYLNDSSKLFLNFSYVINFDTNATMDFYRQDNTLYSSLEIKTKGNVAFGAGYKFKDTYSIELRYNTSREILSNYSYWSSEYKTISMILGYSFF
ncbi:outer membrane beta-barrel protein [Salinimicrobium sp. TIG7-5_MAKvit]|uniref:outer membrane beta-barrel protein n=1 Tax=Salinimicrobium sp. TIG7-5_MAKvit TaxID=3121289 RepID=UPI003C6E10B7